MKILYISEYLKKKSWLNVNSNYGKNNHEIRNFLGPENDPLGVPGLSDIETALLLPSLCNSNTSATAAVV